MRLSVAKRQFIIDNGNEQIPVEGLIHRNVAVKYLMKRRRSLLMTKDPQKVEKIFFGLPQTIKIIGKQVTHIYKVNWKRVGTQEFQGSRFIFTLDEEETGENQVN
jgi:predicted NAD-dependent protein-ADP-ribosyltransferase YbiA (DUF1768 family)